MSAQNDHLIEKMLDAFYDAGGEDSDNMRAALSVARKAILEEAAQAFIKAWDGEPEDAEFYAAAIRSLANQEQPQ
jgi:thioredoxin-like negative regulator of GroEL